ncbi:hypothetical protein SASPL_149867 [Salvia splendens]|uniref:Uncharacterized protein n=1 Tax=Salvia splendens TaxID=180675 RepID=A0A8X8W6F1_SALSN|nr:myosin-2 heavy chain-like [Salvia splendens]XP_042034614.1 myosin-2 heavy chain-like [Salvia splendens]XP_042034615.1 myosin-2 heavy chain-like [Salvia splendens]KAG6388441.1 hypothetical protein SASPL_149867 [Salvia splendens]
MGKRIPPQKASNREKKWDKIFNALVKLSQNLQNDRLILEERIKYLHEFIYKMKMEQKVNSFKAEFNLGFKERESIIFKHRYENAENEAADIKEWCDYLVQKCSGPSDVSSNISNKGALQDEVRMLKKELEKSRVAKNSEISALLAEKGLLWKQYEQMEASLTEKLSKERDEAKKTNEKAQILVSKADELQISNEKLKASITTMESESINKNEEIVKLRKEIETLNSRSRSGSTLLHPCKGDAGPSSRRGKKSSFAHEGKNKSDSSQTTEKTTRTKPSAHKSTGGKAPRKRLMFDPPIFST